MKLSDQLYQYLTQEKGFNDYAAQGLIANGIGESGLKTSAHNTIGEDSRGIFQLKKDEAGRYQAFEKWAKDNNRNMDDWKTHIDYVVDHESKEHSKAVTKDGKFNWVKGERFMDWAKDHDWSSPEEATHTIMKQWERPNDQSKEHSKSRYEKYLKWGGPPEDGAQGVLEAEPAPEEPSRPTTPDSEYRLSDFLGGTAQAAEAPEPPAEAPDGWHAPMSLDSGLLESDEESDDQVYEVQRGDTLSKIAEREGLDWKELAAANNLDNPDLIFPGQKIKLGKKDGGLLAGGGKWPTRT